MALDFRSFTFNPHKKGLRKILGDLEAEIMEIAWKDQDFLVRDIYEILKRRRKIAYTTVMTVMSRLADKGLLVKKKQRQAYVYNAAASRDEFMQSTLKQIINGLLDDFATPVMSQFVDLVGDENPARIHQLAEMIEAKKRQNDD